jgi:hypothetical protein
MGESDKISNQAMYIIEDGHTRARLCDEIMAGDLRTLNDKDFGLLGNGLTEAKPFDVLEQFSGRPWWSSIWTFQELLLGQSFSILCGLRLPPWAAIQLSFVNACSRKSIDNVAY